MPDKNTSKEDTIQKLNMDTIESGRALYAYTVVSGYVKEKEVKVEKQKEQNEKHKSDGQSKTDNYRTRIVSMPMMIKNSGFGATIALYYSKKLTSIDYAAVYEQIEKWLINSGYIKAGISLMEQITSASIDEYKIMTNETMALLAWMKRFAEGLIKSKDNPSKQEKKNHG